MPKYGLLSLQASGLCLLLSNSRGFPPSRTDNQWARRARPEWSFEVGRIKRTQGGPSSNPGAQIRIKSDAPDNIEHSWRDIRSSTVPACKPNQLSLSL